MIVAPLTFVTKNGAMEKFIQGIRCDEANSTMLKKLPTKPILLLPELSHLFTMRTDASNIANEQPYYTKEEKPSNVPFTSTDVNKPEENLFYCRKEMSFCGLGNTKIAYIEYGK